MSVGTPFHPRTAPLNVKMQWREWAGYFASSAYADFHDIEYNAIREAAAVIDVSPLYKYRVTGPDALRLTDRVVTRDASKLKVGQVIYTPWCDEHGKVVDDGTVHRVDEQELRWTAADPQYRWLTMNAAGLDVAIEDVSEQVAALALQGPYSRAVLEAATGDDFSDLRYFRRRAAKVAGVDIDVSRTGYTGDLGYELWIPAEAAPQVWDALFAAGRAYAIRPAGMYALDVTRLEAGLIMLEVDYTSARHAMNPEQNYSPFEIGLGKLVSFDKADFVGRRALEAEVAARRARATAGRTPARLVRHRGPVRRPRPAARDLPVRRPLADPRVRRRPPGREGDLARLEPDPQAGDRPRVRPGALRANRHATPGGVDGRGPPGSRGRDGRRAARSSTSTASAPSPRRSPPGWQPPAPRRGRGATRPASAGARPSRIPRRSPGRRA